MNGRVAAVLGAGPGLGAAVAGEGFAVAMMARRDESLAEIRRDIEGGTALPVSADATDADSVGEAFERVRAESMMVWEVVRSACVSYPPPSE